MADKLVQGYIQVANHLVNDSIILFGAVAISSSALILTNKKINKVNKVVAIIPICYVLGKIIISKVIPQTAIGIKLNEMFFAFERFNINALYQRKVLLKLVSSSFIIGLVAIQLLYVFKENKNSIIAFILYCASICSGLILSLSPTIYASGNRVYTSMDFLLVLINAWTCNALLYRFRHNKSVCIIILVFILLIATLLYVHLFRTRINEIIFKA